MRWKLSHTWRRNASFGTLVAALCLLATCRTAEAAAGDSYCSSGTYGIGLCSGEIFLKSQNIEVGVHRAGSYGTASNAPNSFEYRNKRLGFIADYGRDGWNVGTPPFSGDYFVPGAPVEGWLVQSTLSGTTTSAINKGLMGFSQVGVTTMHITSDDERQSMFWVGQSGNLQVYFNVIFGNDDLYFTTTVILRNIGTSQLKDVYYMRNVDPDQEQPHTGNYATWNWVKYQPFKEGDSAAITAKYVSDTDPNLALVLARGNLYEDLLCGLGTSHPNARVSYFGFDNNNPVEAYSTNTRWLAKGGKTEETAGTSNKHYADEGINLVFYFPTLDVGATAEFDFAYVLSPGDLVLAMDSLSAIKILQPTDIISGNSVLVSFQLADAVGSVTRIVYSLYARLKGASTYQWHLIEDSIVQPADSGKSIFSTTFDSLVYNDKHDVHLKIEVYEDAGAGLETKHVKLKPTSINNVGAQMCFDVVDARNTPFYTGQLTRLTLTRCDGYTGALPTMVQFYREVYLLGNSFSELLKTDTTPGDGFTVDVSVDDLPKGLQIVVKAKSTLGSDITTTTVTGTITEPNYAPHSITLSKLTIAENSAISTTVGTFTAADQNPTDSHDFTLTNDAGGAFAIVGNTLVVNGPIDFEATPTLLIEVRASDRQPLDCCLTQQFTITVLDVNEPPHSLSPTTIHVDEDTPVNTVIAVFTASDPEGDALSFNVLGDTSRFVTQGSALVLRRALDYETDEFHDITISVTDSGSPVQVLNEAVQIIVGDVNEPPTAIILTCVDGTNPCRVEENTAIDTVVGNLSAIDQDVGQTHTFSIVGDSKFKIVGNELQVASNIDYEATGVEIFVTVTAVDSGVPPQSLTRVISIIVLDVDEPPTVNAVECYVDEDRVFGDTVTSSTWSEICMMIGQTDDNTALTYSISEEDAILIDRAFIIQDCSGLFFINGTLDYETRKLYEFEVIVEGTGGSTAIGTATIHVVDVNEPPFLHAETVSVDENVAPGTEIIAELRTDDSDNDDSKPFCCSLDYEIVDGDTNPSTFYIERATGRITLADTGELNYEAVSLYILTVRVTDEGGLWSTNTITIHINDLNEAPVINQVVGSFASIAENPVENTVVGVYITASDEDIGDVLTYSIVSGNVGDAFKIETVTAFGTRVGQLRVNDPAPIDFETVEGQQFELVIRVTDDDPIEPLWDEGTFVIKVTDVNEPPTLPSTFEFDIDENTAAGTLVGAPLLNSLVDVDAGDSHTFLILNYGDDEMTKTFAVSASTGQLFVNKATINYEMVNEYVYTIRATDTGGLYAETTVTITVNDLNEIPTFMPVGPALISEDAPVGAAVATSGEQSLVITAYDDDGDALTFSITTPDIPFAINTLTDASVEIVSTGPLNYEQRASYPISISVTDGELTATTSFTISVLDANDPPVLNDKSCYLAEDSEANSNVCTFSATDEDSTATPWGQHQYEVLSATHVENSENVTSYFDAITSSNLATLRLTKALLVGATPRFPVGHHVVVTVLVTDGGGLSQAANITVIITEVNRPPTCPAGQVFSVDENSDVGVVVGTVNATDSQGDPITGALLSGNLGGVFALDANSLTITVNKNALDFESMPSYSLAISLTDDVGASSMCLVTVNLNDINEPVTFLDQTRFVDENIPAGYLTSSGNEVQGLVASDPDADDQNPTYSMVYQGGDESENPIEVVAETGKLRLKVGFSLNYELKHQYVYSVTWSSRGVDAHATLTVNVNDLPEPPVVLPSSITLDETATGVVGRANAIDPDFEGVIQFHNGEFCEDNCGLRYSIQSGAQNSFIIDINTGVISVSSSGLDYENRASYTLTIRVVDQNGLGTAATNTITVTVLDVSDCAVNHLFLDAGSAPVFGTSGGEVLRINGRDFGPTAARTAESIAITVSYRDRSSADLSTYRYEGIDCHRDVNASVINADIYCLMAPGVGKNLGVVVTIAVVYGPDETSVCTTSFSSAKLSYRSPAIMSMQGHNEMPTQGGSMVTITGSNFGPIAANNIITAKYGPTASEFTSSCMMTVPHSQVVCTSVAGVGAGLSWVVQVAGQNSAPQGGSKYANPSISSLSGAMSMQTSGGESVTLTGVNFGSTSSVVTVRYRSASSPEYTASGCVVTQAHTVVRCTTVPGYGTDLAWELTVGGQTSTPSWAKTSYLQPVIDSVSGPGSFRANTDGGQVVLIAGSQFGPRYSSDDYSHISVTYGPTGDEYTAASCRVSASHSQLECLTVPGTGKDHSWRVWIGDQESALFDAMTSYSPPIVAYYLGAGSSDADTKGGETVTVMGANFGNDDDKIDRVRYAAPNGTVFDASDCEIVVEHTTIICTTVPGAGENLHWVVTVDGQNSESPSTSYAIPLLQSITGAGSYDASVYGGQLVTLTGDYFGPPDAYTMYGTHFLQTVSYGEAGTEYRARDCIVVSHQQIVCAMAPGVGKDLRWSVTVAGQTSALSAMTTNYKAPVISSISPVGFSTAGGVAMTITGSNFATFQVPTVLFNGVRQNTSYTPGQDQLFMTIPEGFGVGITLQVVVGEQPSNVMTFAYDPPVITSVNTKAADNSTITLIMIGRSFSTEPTVTINKDGIEHQVYCPLRTHTQITCLTSVVSGEVTVNVHGRKSAPRYYEYGEARVLYSQLQSGIPAVTRGGATLQVVGQYFGEDVDVIEASVGGRPCEIKTFIGADPLLNPQVYATLYSLVDQSAGFDNGVALQQLTCVVPEGEGQRNSITITRNALPSLGCGCEECSDVSCFDYLPPTVNAVSAYAADTDSRLQVTITGNNFGLNPEVLVGPRAVAAPLVRGLSLNSLGASELQTQSWFVVNATHDEVIVEVAEYEGKDLTMSVWVANQTFTVPDPFAYNPPVLDSSNSAKLIAGTQGSNQTITITGKNFGVLGPQLFLDGVEQPVLAFGHKSLEFIAPAGVGKDLTLAVVVGGQESIPEDPDNPVVFSYQTPVIYDVWPSDLTSDTKGGYLSYPQVVVTIIGDNFGLQSMQWKLELQGQTQDQTTVDVKHADIVSWNHTHILFYVPEGQGENKRLVLQVGEQEALSSEQYVFSYTPPQVHNILPIANPSTEGGYTLTINGTSFGVHGASVTMEDPLSNSTNARMPPTICPVKEQSHERVVCDVPRGVGADVHVTLTVDGRSDWTTFAYAAPEIEFFSQSRGGDASGGESLKVYGKNLGPWRTPVTIWIDDVECSDSEWLADDRLNSFQPYLNCPRTPRTTAGMKNVTVQVAYQTSQPNSQFQVQCKRGFFGGDGEFCVNCGNPESTGFVCDVDHLYLPVSAPGWWRIMQPAGNRYCPSQVRDRELCPSMWPCAPSEACLGNNTCSKKYDPASERCSECADGYFRLNEECRKCPDQPWVIILTAIIVLGTGGYIAQKLNQKRVNLGILSIGVDFFQVLAIFSTTTEWPSEIVDLYNTLSAFNLNIDLSAPECWNSVSFTYKQKWIVIECIPLFLMTIALIIYFSKYAYKRFVKRRRARLQSHLPALIGFVFTFMYYIYLYITTTTLAVFNCQPTEPSDGNRYMAAMGTSGGICYKEGSVQQELEPWAILALIVYVIGFPVLVGTILFRSKTTAVRDQLLRAARKGPREVKAAGTYAFRKRYHRLYFQFKPQFFFWILLILARKFMLGVTALLFRNNVIFLLSMMLLVMFVAYALEVRFQPYMSTADYDKIAADNADALSQILTAEMIRINVEQARKLHKKTRIDDFSDLSRFRPQMTYFHDYNVVESVLLFAIVLVNLSGIMFESGQLGNIETKTLTYLIILIVAASILYFAWVLFSEIWIAFYPNKPLFGMKLEIIKEEDDVVKDDDIKFEFANPDMLTRTNSSDMEAEMLNKDTSLAKQEELIRQQKDEITKLKRELSSKGGISGKPTVTKKKKDFGGDTNAASSPSNSIQLVRFGSDGNDSAHESDDATRAMDAL